MTRTLTSLALLACLACIEAEAETGGYGPQTNYILRCSGCHGSEGLGTGAGGVPPFPDSLGHIAQSDMGRTYMMHVPGVISASLTDAEIAEVMNYLLDRWAEFEAPHFTEAEVTERRAYHVPDVVAYRRSLVERLAGEGIEIAEYPWP